MSVHIESNKDDIAETVLMPGDPKRCEYIARKFAEALAKEYNCTAVCACGIHIDGIVKSQLEEVSECCE